MNIDVKKSTSVSIIQKEGLVKVEIKTERLHMHSYKETDFEDCVSLYSDEVLVKYFDHGKPRSRQDVANLIEERADKYFKNGEPFGLFSIFQSIDMAFIGQLDLIPHVEPGVLELGCIFHRRYHNQGFCPEAVRAFIFAYVDELNCKGFKCKGNAINKVTVSVHPKNHASKRIIRNIGMSLEKEEERFGQSRLWYSIQLNK